MVYKVMKTYSGEFEHDPDIKTIRDDKYILT